MCVMGFLLNYPFYDFGEEIGTIIRFAYFR